jgi:glycosyltransferase involved in cell wall biosynthesis
MLISSMDHANLVALWAAKLARRSTPVVVTLHTTVSQAIPLRGRLITRLVARLARTFYPWAASVVAVSRGVADDFARNSGVARDRIRVVYNPVITPSVIALTQRTPDHPWFGPGQPPVILGVGRLTSAKDFPTLIRAFALFRQRRAGRLMIVGEGEERATLEALIAELGLGDHVALPGFRDDAPTFMAGADLFVLSSVWEGLPTVLIEALAAGTRVISTDCESGPREILQEGRLGALVPPGDAAALAEAMIDALDRPVSTPPAEALTPFTREAAVDHYLQLVGDAS